MEESISTSFTKRMGCHLPIVLAGMGNVSDGKLAAAVSNAGGLGVVGGIIMTPAQLRKEFQELRSLLLDQSLPIGVSLAFPKVGGSARKTNKDYSKGKMDELVDICIEFRISLFACAVGFPPAHLVKKLHDHGITVLGLVGKPGSQVKHVLEAGVDAVCASGSDGGGHTSDVGTLALIPQVLEQVRGHKSPLTGGPIEVLGAGGIVDGKGIAAALTMGCVAVWMGTRFIATTEANASSRFKEHVVLATGNDTIRTIVYTGRPARLFRTPYVMNWESNRQKDIAELTAKGVVPYEYEVKTADANSGFNIALSKPLYMGQGAGLIHDILPVSELVPRLMKECLESLNLAHNLITYSRL